MFLEFFECVEDVAREFECSVEDCGDVKLAWYGDPYGYSGEAFVLFEKDGQLYEVNGSHCSCNGLEGQWDPEETTVEDLQYRMEKGCLGDHGFASELKKVLETI